ncbi:unnamed protein product [Pseudo-nitzschia multistriata]|uniref:Uncharacterized protein n=1 Tax=Pseudo-nitzschia multistriata TaxID=183589 RepID=A0A448ZPU9_9STRA|nr:unnamed protein product [Pseudo-nitzschia multistriata]
MPLHDSSVWTPINADNFKVGTFEACVRISRKHDTDYVVFFDTFFSLKIDAKGLFQTFEQEILVEEFGNVQNYDKEETRKIGVDAYLCGPSTSANPGRSYAIGQSFHVCVGPKQAELEKGFAVVGFHDVTCAGTDVVTDGDFADQLTSVARNPVDFIDGKENPEAVATDAGVAYFETVVTPEFYAGSEAGSFTCEGRVDLEQKSPEEGVGVEIPTRRLTASFSRHSDDLSRRHLQESGEAETDTDTGSSFGITVGLLPDGESADALFGDLAGPAADTGGVPGTAMATAAGAAVLAALL